VDGVALLEAVRNRSVHAALDVWPNEPLLNPELLERSVVATPHVAGYSDDGKRNGTWMVYAAFCEQAGIEPVARGEQGQERLSLSIQNPEFALNEALEAACFVPGHDHAMRALAELPSEQIATGFDQLRKEYPYRRDFHGWGVVCNDCKAAQTLSALGFSLG